MDHIIFTAMLSQDHVDGGYNAVCKEIPAAISQGDTLQEALENIADAITLCLETQVEFEGRAHAL